MTDRQIETKDLRVQVKDFDPESGRFTGYAAVFGNRDSGGDVIEPGAFTKTIADRGGVIPVLHGHDPDEQIGWSTSLKEDDRGLEVEAVVSPKTPRGAGDLELMKIAHELGSSMGLSIGYQAVKRHMEGETRRLTELKLFEFSTTPFPMNELALVTGVKAERTLEVLAEWAKDAKEGRVLSSASRSLVAGARDALQALLDAAEPLDGTQDGKGAAASIDEPGAPTRAVQMLMATYGGTHDGR